MASHISTPQVNDEGFLCCRIFEMKRQKETEDDDGGWAVMRKAIGQ
jgi:hypothetical protein